MYEPKRLIFATVYPIGPVKTWRDPEGPWGSCSRPLQNCHFSRGTEEYKTRLARVGHAVWLRDKENSHFRIMEAAPPRSGS